MGLDMYLYKKTYISEFEKEGFIFEFKNIKKDRVKFITEEIAYWRKANQIHNWFVENCQNGEDDCLEHLVEIEQLKKLYNICKKIQEDFSLAKELLPVKEGFFFGSTSYDEYYKADIKDTITMLESIFKEIESINEKYNYFELIYHSSW